MRVLPTEAATSTQNDNNKITGRNVMIAPVITAVLKLWKMKKVAQPNRLPGSISTMPKSPVSANICLIRRFRSLPPKWSHSVAPVAYL
jgi:hypothetical protein